MIHVLPCDELHRLDTTCDCGPRVEFLDRILVIHESPDAAGWLVVESEDNHPVSYLSDGVMVPVDIEP
jgi:hypothetical protein